MGETGNYIRNRTYVERITMVQVHADMGQELLKKQASILFILAKSPHAIELWEIWEHGYMFVILDKFLIFMSFTK